MRSLRPPDEFLIIPEDDEAEAAKTFLSKTDRTAKSAEAIDFEF